MRVVIPTILLLLAGLLFAGSIANRAELREVQDAARDSARLDFEKRLLPRYEQERPFRGTYYSGFERQVITLCLDTQEPCATPVHPKGGPLECWVEWTKSASAELERLSQSLDGGWGAVQWARLEGRGRLATMPGGFGHLGMYMCQIEISSLAVARPLDPESKSAAGKAVESGRPKNR